MRYHVCLFLGKTNNFDFFDPNLPKNGFWVRDFKNLSADSRSAPPRDYACHFSVKMDNFEFFGLNLGNCPITCDILVLITLRVFQRARWRLKWARWRRWVHGLVILTFLIWRENYILFSRYLDFCTFVKSTDFKICGIIIGITSIGISISAYFFWILSTLKTKFGQTLVCCKTNISDMFLALDWRLGTSSRLFCDFIKMTI